MGSTNNHSNKREVFVSYAWNDKGQEKGREDIVNELEESLKKALNNAGIQFVRDKHNVGFNGLISDFIQRLKAGYSIVAVVSDKYLKSQFCMQELYEVYRYSRNNEEFANRICLIVLDDTDNLYDDENVSIYFTHWDNQKKNAEKRINNGTTQEKIFHSKQLTIINKIESNLSDLLEYIRDVNKTSIVELRKNHFKPVIDKILKNNLESSTQKENIELSPDPKKKSQKWILGVLSIFVIFLSIPTLFVLRKYSELSELKLINTELRHRNTPSSILPKNPAPNFSPTLLDTFYLSFFDSKTNQPAPNVQVTYLGEIQGKSDREGRLTIIKKLNQTILEKGNTKLEWRYHHQSGKFIIPLNQTQHKYKRTIHISNLDLKANYKTKKTPEPVVKTDTLTFHFTARNPKTRNLIAHVKITCNKYNASSETNAFGEATIKISRNAINDQIIYFHWIYEKEFGKKEAIIKNDKKTYSKIIDIDVNEDET